MAVIVGAIAKASDPAPMDLYNVVGNQPITGIPPGAYSAWTEDQRREGFKIVTLACVRAGFAAMMSMSQKSATDDRKKEEILTMVAACVAMHLPKDHPARDEYQKAAIEHYQAAKALGSDVPPPIL